MKRLLIALVLAGSTALLTAPPAVARPTPSPVITPTTSAPTELAWSTDPEAPPSRTNPVVRPSGDAPVAKIWGWCGLFSPTTKLVRTYKKHGGAKVHLYCGGPKYSDEPTWGLRHIERYHENDWENKAFGTFQSWREIADISISAVLADPVVKGPVKKGKRCYSRYVYLWDVSRDRIIDFMTVRVVFKAAGDRRIITAYPADNCKYF